MGLGAAARPEPRLGRCLSHGWLGSCLMVLGSSWELPSDHSSSGGFSAVSYRAVTQVTLLSFAQELCVLRDRGLWQLEGSAELVTEMQLMLHGRCLGMSLSLTTSTAAPSLAQPEVTIHPTPPNPSLIPDVSSISKGREEEMGCVSGPTCSGVSIEHRWKVRL